MRSPSSIAPAGIAQWPLSERWISSTRPASSRRTPRRRRTAASARRRVRAAGRGTSLPRRYLPPGHNTEGSADLRARLPAGRAGRPAGQRRWRCERAPGRRDLQDRRLSGGHAPVLASTAMRSTMMDAAPPGLPDPRPRQHRARRLRGRHLDRRRPRRMTYAEVGAAGRPARPRPARRSRGHRRPAGRHLHVEQRRAPGRLLRGAEHGRRAAHAQPAAVPRPGGLHRQPRRGPRDHRRRHADPAAGQGAAAT